MSRDANKETMASNDRSTEKSFNINTPKTIPPRSERITFFVYRAKAIANNEGIKESAESSIRLS